MKPSDEQTSKIPGSLVIDNREGADPNFPAY